MPSPDRVSNMEFHFSLQKIQMITSIRKYIYFFLYRENIAYFQLTLSGYYFQLKDLFTSQAGKWQVNQRNPLKFHFIHLTEGR